MIFYVLGAVNYDFVEALNEISVWSYRHGTKFNVNEISAWNLSYKSIMKSRKMKKSDVMNSRKNMICGFLYLICQNVRPTVCVEHFGETHNGYKIQMYTSLMMVTALATKFVDGSKLNLRKVIQILKHIECNQ